jgi:hypothetical protein
MERKVLTTIGWKLNPVTPYAILSELLNVVELGNRSVDAIQECERYFSAACYVREYYSPAEIVAGSLEELGEALMRKEVVRSMLCVDEAQVDAFRQAVQEFLV